LSLVKKNCKCCIIRDFLLCPPPLRPAYISAGAFAVHNIEVVIMPRAHAANEKVENMCLVGKFK